MLWVVGASKMGILQSIGNLFHSNRPQPFQPPMVLSQAGQVQAPQEINYNKRKLGGVLGALAYGFAPQAYQAGRNQYQERTIGDLSSPEEQIRAARQFGRYDLIDNITAQQKAQEAARVAELERKRQLGYASAAGQIYGGQMQPTPMQAPMQQNAPQAMQMPNQAPQMPDMTQQAPINPMARLGSAENPQNIEVTAPRQIAQMENRQINPYQEADFYAAQAQKALEFAQGGDNYAWQDFMDFTAKAKAAREAADSRNYQLQSAYLPSGYGVQDNPDTQGVDERFNALNDAFKQLENSGYRLSAHDRAVLERGGAEGDALLRQIVNRGDLKEAAQGEIERQNKPLIFRDQGGFTGGYNAYTGQPVARMDKTIDPNTIYSQQQQNKRNSADNALREKIAANDAKLRKLALQINASQGAERIKLQKQAQAITRDNTSLRAQELQWNRSIGAKANVGDVVDTSGEEWQ